MNFKEFWKWFNDGMYSGTFIQMLWFRLKFCTYFTVLTIPIVFIAVIILQYFDYDFGSFLCE